VASNLTQGTAIGKLLDRANGAYLIQQDADPDVAHTFTTAQTASSEGVRADAGGMAYTIIADATTNPPSLDGNGHPNLTCTTHIWTTVRQLLQHYEIAAGVSLIHSTLQ
jgi:hypothetical protein